MVYLTIVCLKIWQKLLKQQLLCYFIEENNNENDTIVLDTVKVSLLTSLGTSDCMLDCISLQVFYPYQCKVNSFHQPDLYWIEQNQSYITLGCEQYFLGLPSTMRQQGLEIIYLLLMIFLLLPNKEILVVNFFVFF